MSGEADNPEDRRSEGRRSKFDEEILGALGAAARDGELAELDGSPPWQPVIGGDVHSLLGAYRRARVLANELRAALAAVGIRDREVPGISGSIDAEGRPVVMLGTVDAVTAQRLVCVVRGGPIPPADEGKDKAA